MYKTKKEVDAHVRTALSKLRSETERQLRSFTIAKLYYKINEYSSAEQYLRSYLSVKEDNDQAHKLLGQCYQRFKKPDKALQSFQRSLQLNPKQPDVLADVCQLLLEDGNLNVNKAKYWCELAESEKVQHDAVFSLRLKLMNKENLETNQVEDLIQKEISARPNDVQLRVRLMRNYIEQNKVLDAFKYVYNLEMSLQDNFTSNSEWYNIVWLVLNKYEQMPNSKKDWEFWLLLIICLERQVNISFSLTSGSATGGLTETANLLFNLDQYLFKATQLADKMCAQRELVNVFLDHYRGQMLIHAAALIFKRELLQNKNKWKETTKMVLPLLLLAFQTDVPDNRDPWMKHSDEQGKQMLQLWNREGSFRCAQAGRTLLSCIAEESATNKENATNQINNLLGNNPPLWSNSDELLSQIRQTCSDKQWRRNVFALLYCNSDQKVKEQTSLLIKSPKLNEPVFELPTYADVERHEEAAQYLKPQSLQHMVYLCLGNNNLAYVRAKYFSGLNFSTQNLAFCGAESLNQLDLDTFLYAATIQAKRTFQVEREAFDNYNSGNHSSSGRPRILPFVNLQGQLSTTEQANWWLAAYQVYKNLSSENLAELRANLQFGIEAVRGVNGPKIDMIIVFKLGQLFVARAQDIVKPIEKSFLEARAENIYKYGLNMVKMNNKGVLEPFRKYFKYAKANTSVVEREVFNAAEDAVSYLASRYFKKAEYEDLIEELAGIQLPFATYLQAEAYRKLDEANKTPKKAKRMYLDRASECLNQTLNLLKNTGTNPDHPLNSIIHTELKRLQQATMKFINEGSPGTVHNNSSTYEDAETDFYYETSLSATPAINRSRREANASALIASPRNNEMENLVKQMAKTLSFVKEELVDTIKPEMLSMRKEITSLKEKITSLEDAMKRTRISSNPPSRDDASNVLDDLYMIEDALQSQLYQPPAHPHMNVAGSMFGGVGNGPNAPPPGGVHNSFVSTQQSQQQAAQQRNAMHLQPNAMAAYNSPMFNPNYPMNYYPQPYMMPQPPAPPGPAGGMLGQRNALPMPYMDAGLNFSMTPSTPLLPAPPQEGRPSNLYGLLTQPQQPPPAPPQFPQLSVPSNIASLVPPVTANAALNPPTVGGLPPSISSQLTPASAPIQFNKALNNQPVEKGPPANVVITSSDPLPNPNRAALLTQQPTLSVTIPPHHIKSSLVATTEGSAQNPPIQPIVSQSANTITNGIGGSSGGFTGFGFSSASTVAQSPFSVTFSNNFATSASSAISIFSGSSGKSVSSTLPSTTLSTTTFSFKPQIDQAQAQAAAAAGENSSVHSFTMLNKTSSSFSGEANKSSANSEVEYDARPDFKPIIPLPDEIEVRTGEEDEDVMFCCRAKLYRFVDKDWKERGIGDMKILKSKEGSSRILMRRDQTHKICANHKITKELILTTHTSEKNGYIWVANDFADEELKTERFFARFKLQESAQQFYNAFKKAQKEAEELDRKKEATISEEQKEEEKPATQQSQPTPFGLTKGVVSNFTTSTPAAKTIADKLPAATQSSTVSTTATANALTSGGVSKSLFGGFALKSENVTNVADSSKGELPKPTSSPFANFSFDKIGTGTSAASLAAASSTTTITTASPFANIFSNLGKPGTSTSSPFSIVNLPTFQSPITTSAPTTTQTQTSTTAITTTPLNKSSASDAEDEYVPTAAFNPVIPLPDLVEVSTGEENEIVLFEHRAKLLRFDKETSEWKERGIGNIKLLQDKDDVNKVRLVMRREQIHKLCCNQRLYKNTVFKYAKNSQTALTWAGQDFSENELVTEMLTVRFKLSETCKQFHEAVTKAQANMSDKADADNVKTVAAEKQQKQKQIEKSEDKENTAKGFGDAFKPKIGSWNCTACYITNTSDKQYCIACESPKDGTVPKKEATNVLLTNPPKASFVFGFSPAATGGATEPAQAPESSLIFGKPAATSSTLTMATTTLNSATSSTTPATSTPSTTKSGFGDQFKPKVGSWNCQGCYLSNTADAVYCKACDAPKDDTVPKKESKNDVLALSNPTQKFSFGFGAVTASPTTSAAGANALVKPASTGGFAFGAAPPDPGLSLFGKVTNTTSADLSKTFAFTPSTATITTTGSNIPLLSKPTFSFSMQSKAMDTPAMLVPSGAGGESTTTFSLDKKDFNFTLKPKSPGKSGKSPIRFGGGGGDADAAADDGDDGDYQEEENNTYFTPVIPLPEKIDVKTGEEDEELLYVHRAKLYRFVEGEWKERGLGDVKILRHKQTKKLRVVMRRDQVLKICLNHALNEEVEYKRKDDKSWLFVVNDFSEGSVELQQFSLRFKTKEVAQGFMDAVKNATDGTAVAIENEGSIFTDTTTNITENVKSEKKVLENLPIAGLSDADRVTADKLQLPYEFFTAQPTCAGCRGCDPDKFIFPVVKEKFVSEEESEMTLKPMELPTLSLPNRLILKQSALSPLALTPAATALTSSASNVTATPKAGESSIFSGFGGVNSTAFGISGEKTASAFSFTAAMNSANKDDENKLGTPSGGFLFGNSANTGGGSSIFGGATGQSNSIFGNAANSLSKPADSTTASETDKPKSIFSGTGGTTGNGSVFASKPVFGSGSTSVFDGKSTPSNEVAKPIFGSSTNAQGGTSIFGGSTFSYIFGVCNNTNTSNAKINNTEGSLFGGITKESTAAAPSFIDISNQSDVIDFATLASLAKADGTDEADETPTNKLAENPGPGGFIGLTDQDAFSSFAKPGDAKNSTKNADNENYDPHYDPIIALPDEIEVRTGEEEEFKIFCERATLYRFDANAKEWKERGVGMLKILEHNTKHTYRMILRREQVFKLVLNTAIGPDFILNNMKNNPKSFIFASLNYAESAEGILEKLVVRFKTVDLGKEFKQKFNECIEAAKRHIEGTED
ncbi:E3 SUMO-protein ligase RanBP2 [Anastrepha obliqua]|uniref:E3 SUMO-protein ligase RanBP2 n=1 Tax=Anastrepha obliqua TaxID=95512 RepID=UPI002409E2F0|nr:E3 SUMO-protein ligase RanBP2 [Anastrepha obliqua]